MKYDNSIADVYTLQKSAAKITRYPMLSLVLETQQTTIVDAYCAHFVNEIPAVPGTNKARK
jgi:hypothetical protein